MPIPGSAPKTGAQPRWSSAVDPDQLITVTITLRRQGSADLEKQLLSGHAPLSREEAAQQLSADPHDVAAVRSFVEQYGLKIVDENAAARTLKVQGTVQQMQEAFSTKIGWFEDSAGSRHLSYQGPLSIPESLSGTITSVLGLDQRPIARSHPSVG